MGNDYLSDILIVYCFIAVWFVGRLTVFHSYLICTNQKTYENFRHRYNQKGNPYDRKLLRNIHEVFFSRIPHSMNNFRAFDEVEEIVEASMTSNYGEGNRNPQEKIDIEMGMKFAEDGHPTLPEILRNIDCDELDDDINCKEVEGSPDADCASAVEAKKAANGTTGVVDDSSVVASVEEDVKRQSPLDPSHMIEHEDEMQKGENMV